MPAHLLAAALLALAATQDPAPPPDASETEEVTGSSAVAEAAPAAPANAAAASADEDPDRMICRRAEPVLGSRVRMRRMCMTAAQWRVYRDGRDAMRRQWQNQADPLAIE